MQTIGVFGGNRAQAMLEDIYERSEDREVRVAVLHGYMISGQKASLLEVLRRERDGELRETAIQQLGVMGASDQLEALYDELESVDERAAVLSAFMISGKVDALARIARTERNPDLREAAIQQLGVSGADGRAREPDGAGELAERARGVAPGLHDLRQVRADSADCARRVRRFRSP